jgi:putative membrane protein
MKRSLKEYVVISLKGMAMGAADVVPGVSGGTIAFISGIYEELLNSISSFNFSLIHVFKNEGFKSVWIKVNGNFLVSLFVGILISVLSLAKLIESMLENHPIVIWSFFFGLVLASVIYIGKQITKWTKGSFLCLILGAILAFYITTLNPMVSANSSPWFLFFAGMISICAMILPGISGSFILVLLGAYKPVLNALNTKDFVSIIIFLVGAVLGLLSFSRILKWLFSTYKNYTLATLTGFIIGSLNKIWPWKETISWRTNSKGIEVPFNTASVSPFSFEGDSQLLISIFLMLIGFGLIILLEKLAIKKD